MIPTFKDCIKLMERYDMPDHIREHSFMVERVASIITKGLQDAGIDLSSKQVTAGALMHDISKPYCLKNGGDHAARGRDICLRHHFYEIADIVGEHVRLKDYDLHQQMEEHAILMMVKSFNKFDPEKSDNPFAYLVQVTKCAFANIKCIFPCRHVPCAGHAIARDASAKLDFASIPNP